MKRLAWTGASSWVGLKNELGGGGANTRFDEGQIWSFETLVVLHQITQDHTSEDNNLHICSNLKSHGSHSAVQNAHLVNVQTFQMWDPPIFK
jgi:hypothetical protein